MSRYERVEFDVNADDLRVYAAFQKRWTANTQFRVATPLAAIQDSDMGVSYQDEVVSPPLGNPDDVAFKAWQRDREEGMLASSLSTVRVLANAGNPNLVDEMKQVRKECREKGRKPPVFVYDAEDLNTHIHPLNPAFRWLGTADENGRPLEDGDEIWHTSPRTGVKRRVLKVGETEDFDLEANQRRLENQRAIAKECDLVTCTTEPLAEHYRTVVGCKDVMVYPNSVRPHTYPQVFLEKNPEEVRILWQGGNSHLVDWEPITDVVRKVLERYPQAKFVFWGQPFGVLTNSIPEGQYEQVEWGSYEAFHARLATVNIDINLCPLADNPFNRCKSAIKWYEPSMLAQPPATVAADVGPYQEIQDGKTGLLYSTPEELERCLGLLIEDAGLRVDLGHAARDWVLGHRHYLTTIVPYAEKLTEKLKARPMPLVEV